MPKPDAPTLFGKRMRKCVYGDYPKDHDWRLAVGVFLVIVQDEHAGSGCWIRAGKDGYVYNREADSTQEAVSLAERWLRARYRELKRVCDGK